MKATSITIKYDDGSIEYANGDDATKIMDWYHAVEQLAMVHGAVYQGPKLRHITTIDVIEDAPEGGGLARNNLMVFDGLKDCVKTQGV